LSFIARERTSKALTDKIKVEASFTIAESLTSAIGKTGKK
jgi:hypothetical protein